MVLFYHSFIVSIKRGIGQKVPQEENVRDISDRTIMRAAVAVRVDVILTGDKDFLESGIVEPKIMNAAAFLAWHS